MRTAPRQPAAEPGHNRAIATERLAADAGGLSRAVALLRAGRLVAFPTETVYGLGADARDPRAIAALYAAKGRPRFNPLIAHVADIDGARAEGVLDARALDLAAAFWPGPLTLVVQAARGGSVHDLARAGLGSVALRMPGHELARALIAGVGRPVVAPSANRSGRLSPVGADAVLEDLDGRIDAVLDGGRTEVGVESTIVSVLGGEPALLRPGGVPREAIERVLGRSLAGAAPVAGGEGEAARLSPGLLASHYAPAAAVRLDAATISPGEAALLFGPNAPEGVERACAVLNLSGRGDLGEAAGNLFAHLRRLDAALAASEPGAGAPATRRIAVAPIPPLGLGEAIRDRLARAAAERE